MKYSCRHWHGPGRGRESLTVTLHAPRWLNTVPLSPGVSQHRLCCRKGSAADTTAHKLCGSTHYHGYFPDLTHQRGCCLPAWAWAEWKCSPAGSKQATYNYSTNEEDKALLYYVSFEQSNSLFRQKSRSFNLCHCLRRNVNISFFLLLKSPNPTPYHVNWKDSCWHKQALDQSLFCASEKKARKIFHGRILQHPENVKDSVSPQGHILKKSW